MCLYLNANSKILTARKDITVYKMVRKPTTRSTRTFEAIYSIQKYVLGQTVKTSGFNKGLHSASSKRRAKQYGGDVLLECIIPKGTKYIRGKYTEITSLALKPLRVIK